MFWTESFLIHTKNILRMYFALGSVLLLFYPKGISFVRSASHVSVFSSKPPKKCSVIYLFYRWTERWWDSETQHRRMVIGLEDVNSYKYGYKCALTHGWRFCFVFCFTLDLADQIRLGLSSLCSSHSSSQRSSCLSPPSAEGQVCSTTPGCRSGFWRSGAFWGCF